MDTEQRTLALVISFMGQFDLLDTNCNYSIRLCGDDRERELIHSGNWDIWGDSSGHALDQEHLDRHGPALVWGKKINP